MKEIISFNNSIKLCVSENDEWLLNYDEKRLPVNDSMVPLLPLLEEDFEKFIRRINEMNVSKEIFETFPMMPLLKYPFDNKRIGWAEFAMNWIEKLPKIDDLKEWSEDISLDWMPQKLKHRFFKKFRAGRQYISSK